MKYQSNSPEDTAKIAAKYSKVLKAGDVVCLNGDLGVGKTVFVQALAKALGVDEYISSPTFTIVNQYQGKFTLYHFDAYRIADCDEMYEIGYDEYVYGDGICIIEWGQNISEILPEERYEITIEKDYDKGENYRLITIEKLGKELLANEDIGD
ncbi:MAG: tRNA (adenosine(37)-N6)-threonylcarbamoyltransferase complex ATPase subunit type 1 TsaE [Clostridia bacterium]|nr:tRNA (adenosine(37)-N6)-threonylcarbamoyltransferase complex ATPase subunit type 1 TsaE [Clostridia bacterium]